MRIFVKLSANCRSVGVHQSSIAFPSKSGESACRKGMQLSRSCEKSGTSIPSGCEVMLYNWSYRLLQSEMRTPSASELTSARRPRVPSLESRENDAASVSAAKVLCTTLRVRRELYRSKFQRMYPVADTAVPINVTEPVCEPLSRSRLKFESVNVYTISGPLSGTYRSRKFLVFCMCLINVLIWRRCATHAADVKPAK